MTSKTSVLYLNHSSVLIRYNNYYLLCDPWLIKPAFRSWLPNPPMHVNPAYLIALEEKLSILISHGHDDHCDDELLSVFDKNTKIITSDFKSPGVKSRLSKIGFKNIYEVGKDGKNFDVFHIKSFKNEKNSLDDALYTICTPDSAIIHANDI